jgi:hypothetical protein
MPAGLKYNKPKGTRANRQQATHVIGPTNAASAARGVACTHQPRHLSLARVDNVCKAVRVPGFEPVTCATQNYSNHTQKKPTHGLARAVQHQQQVSLVITDARTKPGKLLTTHTVQLGHAQNPRQSPNTPHMRTTHMRTTQTDVQSTNTHATHKQPHGFFEGLPGAGNSTQAAVNPPRFHPGVIACKPAPLQQHVKAGVKVKDSGILTRTPPPQTPQHPATQPNRGVLQTANGDI